MVVTVMRLVPLYSEGGMVGTSNQVSRAAQITPARRRNALHNRYIHIHTLITNLRDRLLKTNSEKHSYCITLCCPHAPALDLCSALLLLLQSLKLRHRPADSHSKLHNNCMHAGGRPAEPTPY